MGEKIISTCYIFGGYIEEFSSEIVKSISNEDFVICADKGILSAQKYGIKPNLIIGDFDSFEGVLPNNSNIIKLPKEKDDTDLHYAAKKAVEMGFNNVVLSGVTGGRIDMTLATIGTLCFLDESGINASVMDNSQQIYITHSSLTINKPPVDVHLSVFPVGDKADGFSISGAYYSAENISLLPSFPMGVSNSFLEESVQISIKKGTVIVLLIKKD